MNNKIKNKQGQDGFTLVEVMIAMAIFGFFITAFIMSQGANINGSVTMAQDLVLQGLAERKINEVLLDKPVFSNTTENQVETKNFEEDEFKIYKYTIEYKKLEFPDLSQLTGSSEDEEERADNNSAVKKMVFEKLKKNMEKALWQVRVTITNTETDYSYSLSTWLTNDRAQLDLNFNL